LNLPINPGGILLLVEAGGEINMRGFKVGKLPKRKKKKKRKKKIKKHESFILFFFFLVSAADNIFGKIRKLE
jgi:hypothetical protein